MLKFDFLIVGAGFSGLTFAERSAANGKTCLVVEKRSHLGGNAYDKYDDYGVLIHNYGPHYFRTNSTKIVDYLSKFTKWHSAIYQILSFCEGRYWKFPINLNTFEQILGRSSTSQEMETWLEARRIPIENPSNSEEVIISQVGWELYEKFFKGYTYKQWKRHPKDLDASVCGRIPIRTNRDDRYLSETFQALPKAGYTRMFERMVEACGNKVQILLNTDFQKILPHINFQHLVYTGAIDEYYDFEYGRLPYRSLRFEAENFSGEELKPREAIARKPGFWQSALQINYPNDEKFTRIVEIKHATGQTCLNSTIVREYPDDYGPGKEAYYPIPAPDSTAQYNKYINMAEKTPFPKHLKLNSSMSSPTVSFIGRLATYRYLNMDQVVGLALKEAQKILKLKEDIYEN